MAHGVAGFGAKNELLRQRVAGRSVLHLGAVGETMGTTEQKVAAMRHSVHAAITTAARQCVGIDYDVEAVNAIMAAGLVDNLIGGDVYHMKRSDVPLDTIDVIVAGDIIEHLSNPGLMLASLAALADPETTLIVTVPNAAALPQFLRHAVGKPIEGGDHKVSFNVYTLRHLLEENGWSVQGVTACYQSAATTLNSGLAFNVGTALFRRFPHLAGTLMATATVSGTRGCVAGTPTRT